MSQSKIELKINDLVRSLQSRAYEDEIAIVDICGPLEMNSFPVKVDALVTLLCVRGTGRIKIDIQEFLIEEGTLFSLFPRNYVAQFEVTSDFLGKILICNKQMMERILPKLMELLPLMIRHPGSPVMKLTSSEIESFENYYGLLESKIEMADSPFKKQKLTSLLQSLLYEILEIKHQRPGNFRPKKSRKEQIMASFIVAVAEKFRDHRDVSYYADQLCITPKHLSAVVKEISGMPASDWIDQYVIMEAKVLLRTTDHTVQEISTMLNFANQSFFGKYFKHIVGVSPTGFRSS